MSAVIDRRQQARNAGWDAVKGMCIGVEGTRAGIEATAIAATQVKITSDIVQAFTDDPDLWPSIEGPLIAAFRAAGFEVVE